MIDAKQAHAYWVMGIALVKHLLRLPFEGRKIPAPWLARLKTENLAPSPKESWNYIAETSRCIGCGLCDVAAQNLSVSGLIVGGSRQPADAPLVLQQMRLLEQVAHDIAKICPTSVRVETIVRLVRENARALEPLEPQK